MVSLYDFCMENGKEPLLAQWSGQNAPLTPQTVGHASRKKVWWRCEKGHSYMAAVSARVRTSSGCPYCAGRKVLPGFNDLATKKPLVAAQWDFDLNGDLTPQSVSAGSRNKVWWRCSQGHRWRAAIYARTAAKGTECPVCAGQAKRSEVK